MRVFVAITLPEDLADALEDLALDLRAGEPVPVENLHLTLAFLGEQPQGVVEDLHLALGAVQAPGFDLRIAGLDIFGPETAPRLIHAAVDPVPGLTLLHRKILGALHDCGLMPDRSRFRPHITLRRFSRRLEPADLARIGRFLAAQGDFALPPFAVDSFALFESRLGRQGAQYTELARYPLTPPVSQASAGR